MNADKEYKDLLVEAALLAVSVQKASVGLFNRRLTVSYIVARQLLDDLEELGIVSSTDGVGPRKTLVRTSDEALAVLRDMPTRHLSQ